LVLVLAVLPLIWLLHLRTQETGTLSGSFLFLEILLASLVLSAGPFLYALFVRRNTYFQEQHLAGLTHELKSPLAAIQNALDFLSGQETNYPTGSREAEYLDMLQRNSTRLTEFVDELLITLGPESNRQQLRLEDVDLTALCGEVIERYRALAGSKGVRLELMQGRELPAIKGDRNRIEKVISNLLSNALKFTGQGQIQVYIEAEPHEQRVCVRDTGVGVPAPELPHLFDRFYQGRAGQAQKGSGIGLSIAKAWVEAHGGRIWAESDGEGKGTTVSFSLPLS
jgi:signal transduction histidine kinase